MPNYGVLFAVRFLTLYLVSARLHLVVDKNTSSLENYRSLKQVIENAFSSYPNLLRILTLCYRMNYVFFTSPVK